NKPGSWFERSIGRYPESDPEGLADPRSFVVSDTDLILLAVVLGRLCIRLRRRAAVIRRPCQPGRGRVWLSNSQSCGFRAPSASTNWGWFGETTSETGRLFPRRHSRDDTRDQSRPQGGLPVPASLSRRRCTLHCVWRTTGVLRA